jgi:hypothetical protein
LEAVERTEDAEEELPRDMMRLRVGVGTYNRCA